MRKAMFLAVVLWGLSSLSVYATELNTPDAVAFRGQSSRSYGRFRSERVIINWHDGIQQMMVSPRLIPDANSLWIFPLQCNSEQIKFRLTNDSPYFIFGTDCRDIAGKVLDNVNYAVIATQLWTIPLYYFREDRSDYRSSPDGTPAVIDSTGIHLELLKADSLPALAQQLKERGKPVQETHLEPYAKYLGHEYSLLTVWREEENEPNTTQGDFRRSYRRRPGIYMEFPSEKPFYPMTQMDGRPGLLSLTLTGFWQIAGQEQSTGVQCNQQVVQHANIPDVFGPSPPQKNVPLTTISLYGEGDQTQNNLTFVPGRLEGTAYADAVSKMPYLQRILWGFLALAVISYVSAGVSGLLTYRKWQGFAECGLWNLLTIVAMGIVMNYKKSGICLTFQQNKRKASIFIVLFSVIMVLLSFALFALLKIPLTN